MMSKIILVVWLLVPLINTDLSKDNYFSIMNEREKKLLIDSIIYLNIPVRLDDALNGNELVNKISAENVEQRENRVAEEILAGNVPSFSRKLKSIKINQTIDKKNYEVIFFATIDYIAVGSDQEYLYIPMTPSLAQKLADVLNCSLPTKKMVDIIYNQAEIKLTPQPIPPSDEMTSLLVFKQHTDSIKHQFDKKRLNRLSKKVIAGHKKDVIISKKIYTKDRSFERVVIYGWHKNENNPIQSVYNGHRSNYADYSHGIRLISNKVIINGNSYQIRDVLQDPRLSVLLSDEGKIVKPYYTKRSEQ